MSTVLGARCPWMDDGRCHTNCMLFVTAVNSETISAFTVKGKGHCAIAVAASHISSEKHYGGNYLVKTIAYNDETEDPEMRADIYDGQEKDRTCEMYKIRIANGLNAIMCGNCGVLTLNVEANYCPGCGSKVASVQDDGDSYIEE